MNTTTKTLYPAEVQRAIFNQLITYEHLLEDGYRMDISRPSGGKFWIYVYPAGHPELSSVAMISTRSLTTAKKLDEAVTRWWENIPKEWKKQPS